MRVNLVVLVSGLLLSILLCHCSPNETQDFSINSRFDEKDFSLRALEKLTSDSLRPIDSTDELSRLQKTRNSGKFYYYDSLLHGKFISYIYYYFNEGKESSFLIANYNFKKQLIDLQPISSLAGDGGSFDYSDGKFINDSTIIRIDKVGGYDFTTDSIVQISHYNKIRLRIQDSGKTIVDTLERKENYTEKVTTIF